MSVIKSFSVGDGDMFYINHNSDNFTTIDCCYSDDDNKETNFEEMKQLANKKGITRYGHFTIPMDEALVTCDLDISGRSFLVFNVDIPKVNLGNYESEMTEEFFRAVAYNMNATLHLNEAYGNNVHHVIEACFKAFGRALKEAVRIDEKNIDKIVSSKGVL